MVDPNPFTDEQENLLYLLAQPGNMVIPLGPGSQHDIKRLREYDLVRHSAVSSVGYILTDRGYRYLQFIEGVYI